MSETTSAGATFEQVRAYHAELTAIRRDIHAHPELGLDTHRTADIVAGLLKSWGIEVHRLVNGAADGGRAPFRQRSAVDRAPRRHGRAADPRADRRRPPEPTSVSCTPAATTGTRPCCSARRATWPRRASSTARSTSFSSRARRAWAARSPCWGRAARAVSIRRTLRPAQSPGPAGRPLRHHARHGHGGRRLLRHRGQGRGGTAPGPTRRRSGDRRLPHRHGAADRRGSQPAAGRMAVLSVTGSPPATPTTSSLRGRAWAAPSVP